MFAVVEYKKQQYRVSEGDTLLLKRIKDAQKGDVITVDTVLLIAEDDGSDVKIGTPTLNASVEFEVIGQELGDKIRSFKMKAKKRYRKTIGERPKYTKVSVKKIGKVSVKKAAPKKEESAE